MATPMHICINHTRQIQAHPQEISMPQILTVKVIDYAVEPLRQGNAELANTIIDSDYHAYH